MSEYAGYPGGESFEPWQDHEWPTHCGVPARYLGEIGARELAVLSGGAIETFLLEHDAHQDLPPITLEMVPPCAPAAGETWESTIHHFRCVACGWGLLLWDAS